MMMQLGAEGVFVGSGIFKSGKVSRGLGEAMVGINVEDIAQPHRLADRGW
jgi:pyridoxal 5'-phosphate synthase pdxS subunit